MIESTESGAGPGSPADPPLNVVVLSTVFPNPTAPYHGLFVFERIRHTAQAAAVRVFSPVPWFRGRRGIPSGTQLGSLAVEYPTAFYVPRFFKWLDGALFFLSLLVPLRRLRRTFLFNLIDSHFAQPDGVAGVLLGQWFGCPVVITMRGSEADFAERALTRRVMGWALRRATAVIAVSQSLATLAEELGVPPARVHLISNGVDTTRFAPRDKAAMREALGLPAHARILVSIGHMVPRKGFHRLLPVFARLRQRRPDVYLVLVGGTTPVDWSYEEEMKRLAAELNVGDSVLFTGAQSPDRIAQWLNASDLFVLASAREGCPNVVWEAMASAVPVVASDVGETKRMVPPFAGTVYSPFDDLRSLETALDEALAAEWDLSRVRGYAEVHTWDRVARRVVDVWQAASRATRM
jgi:glycosyltransferase involved in cell wall biosynthesis